MTEIPKPGVTEKDINNQNSFRWGFFSGLDLLTPQSKQRTDIVHAREEAIGKLADISRTLPQMGSLDPAGMIERTIASTTTRAAERVTRASETPAGSTPTKRGMIRRIFGR
jgi:hypothetical protein